MPANLDPPEGTLMQSTKSQRGFTLIELVVVITILGVLAAFAVPRFAGLEKEARLSTVHALAGSLRSGAALSHALWLAQGQPPSVTMEGNTAGAIVMANGYPNLASIDDTISDLSGFQPYTGNGVFRKSGTPATSTCTVTYAQAPANGAPTVTVNATAAAC
jgi:MSHA pilin protein MshA